MSGFAPHRPIFNGLLAHSNLGNALGDKGLPDEAIAEYREAIRIKKDDAEAHCNLGAILCDSKRDYDGAIAEFREAIRLKKNDAIAHFNLGNALKEKGLLDEAIAEYRKAIRLKKDFAKARNYLLRVEQMARIEVRLARVLEGKDQSKDAAESLGFAELCQLSYRRQYAAAVRFFREAFADKPELADDRNVLHRYNAACVAALAGCGQGKDADKLDTKERARLRQQALDWLRADLKAYRQVMEKNADKAGPEIAQRMQHWLQDTDFAGVRGPESLARLPGAERKEWQKLWEEVEALLMRATGER